MRVLILNAAQPGQWQDLQPGEHELHAILADLGVRTAEPLRIMLSDAEIEANRPPQRTSPPSEASQQEARIEALLECTAEAAGAVLALSLQRLVPAEQDRIVDEIRELERELETDGEPPLS